MLIMSLESTNHLVFIIDTDCVSCKIGTKVLRIVLINVSIQTVKLSGFYNRSVWLKMEVFLQLVVVSILCFTKACPAI